MKKLIILLAILSTGFFSCKKDKTQPAVETETSTLDNATVIAAGSLTSPFKTNTGQVNIYQQKDGKYTLGLENMNVNGGRTSVVIYLSPTETVNSSAIKICSVATLYGNVYHDLPANFDYSQYKYLIIEAEPNEEIIATAILK